jgi:hypothetical protein
MRFSLANKLSRPAERGKDYGILPELATKHGRRLG